MAVDPVTVLLLGTAIGSLYALLSVGLTLVYAIGGVENLAHGSYAYFVGVGPLGLPPIAGRVIAILMAILAALITWKGIVEHIIDRPVAVFIWVYIGAV